MNSLGSKLVVPIALLGLAAMPAACLPEPAEESYPVAPNSGWPVSTGTGAGDRSGTGGNGTPASVDAPARLLDAAPLDAGIGASPSDA